MAGAGEEVEAEAGAEGEADRIHVRSTNKRLWNRPRRFWYSYVAQRRMRRPQLTWF